MDEGEIRIGAPGEDDKDIRLVVDMELADASLINLDDGDAIGELYALIVTGRTLGSADETETREYVFLADQVRWLQDAFDRIMKP